MTKQKVLECVRQQTLEVGPAMVAAAAISEALGVSRNLVSQYLNELWNEGLLVKVKSRPVCFYHRQAMEETFGLKLTQLEFATHEELDRYLEKQGPLDFGKLIGVDSSLAKIVEQCKATVSYPPNGLPLLLHGPSGSGKSFLAQLIYEYAVNNHIIGADKRFITLNCSDYANNPELLTDNLFGHKKGAYTGADSDNDGLIKLADGGFLFLDEIHSLTAECQEKLFLYMDKGIYHVMGDNETWYHASARLIFATTEKPRDALLKTLLRRIPVVLRVPSLPERPVTDKVQLIRHFFQQEEEKMARAITLTPIVYHTLLQAQYAGDVGELKNTVKASCISAFFPAGESEQPLRIRLRDLPEKLLLENPFDPQKSLLTDLADIQVGDLGAGSEGQDNLTAFYQQALATFCADTGEARRENLLDLMYDQLYNQMLQYKDGQNEEFVRDTTRQILNIVADKYKLFFSNNLALAIANYVSYSGRHRYLLDCFYQENLEQFWALEDYVKAQFPLEYKIAEETCRSLEIYLDSEADPLLAVLVSCNIYLLNKNVHGKQLGVILAHGYSTASSIAEAANSILGQYLFESIDMPMQVSVDSVVAKLEQWVTRLKGYEDILILVDMGSLEEIYQGLASHHDLNIGIINNVTTRMALAVGEGIQNKLPVEAILAEASQHCAISSRVIRSRRKEDIILCSCASGLGTAERLKDIVVNSLPSPEALKVITCDYHQLLEKSFREQLKQSYHVLCIVGTLNPNLPEEDLVFLPIDELISGKAMPALDQCLGEVLTAAELTGFKQNVLKNFSLLNIVNNLTILNPHKVIDQVMEALDKLQLLEGTTIDSGLAVGLYVHVCCLIEKLLTRQNPGNYQGIEAFQQKHGAFITNVQEAFRGLEQYYRVEIPVDEIGYIYDYVYGTTALLAEDSF